MEIIFTRKAFPLPYDTYETVDVAARFADNVVLEIYFVTKLWERAELRWRTRTTIYMS